MNYILAIDQGTTGTTASLIDAKSFQFLGECSEDYPQIFPQPGWVEHNLNDIWHTVENTVTKLLKKFNVTGSQILSIGITNQRETTCAFKKDGTPLHNAIVWQDRRTENFCQELRAKNLEPMIKQKTGLTLDPYFSATKMRWLLEHSPAVKMASNSQDLLFGTIDTFLLYKLTGHTIHSTDSSNASRTLLFNLKSNQWDAELTQLFQIPHETLPEIKVSIGQFGVTKNLSFLPDGITINCILGDQQAALFGQGGQSKGSMKCTYGTGAFLLFNTGENLIHSQHGLLTTVFFSHQGQTFYAIEGSTYIAGALVQWLRDQLKIIKESAEVEALANQVKNLDEMKYIMFFPFFTGIGSPHWNANAKAALVGLTRDSSSAHIARAALEGIALSINDLIDAMRQDANISITELRVDGGAVMNSLLMEFQATFSGLTIVRPKVIETTSYGAALGAGVGKGIIKIDELNHLWKKDRDFHPLSSQNEQDYFSAKKMQWKHTIKKIF